MNSIRYVDPYAQHGRLYRAYCSLSATKAGLWLSEKLAWKLDPWLLSHGLKGFSGPLASAVLETRGARTGQPRRTAVLYFHDGEAITIVASKAGASTHPGWYFNLAKNPAARFAGQPYTAHIITEDKERLWQLADNVFPPFAQYRARAGREIPIIQLLPQ
ncbi:MAG: nitroreductase family deazaflavin-dependent oxidoreductase [Solirubrobacterales bacterium]|nr:nitroreductase family deazaflavin-dependent oxidoreductase [Solirubrobacterales bacterium]